LVSAPQERESLKLYHYFIISLSKVEENSDDDGVCVDQQDRRSATTTPTLTNNIARRPQHLDIKQEHRLVDSSTNGNIKSSTTPIASTLNRSMLTPSSQRPDTTKSPLKTKKTFRQPLPVEKMKMPYDLDKWLEDMVIANRARLKRLDSNDGNNNTQDFTPVHRPYTARTPAQQLLIEGTGLSHTSLLFYSIYHSFNSWSNQPIQSVTAPLPSGKIHQKTV